MCDVCGKVTAEYGTRCAKHKGHTHKRTKGLCQHPDGCEKVGWYGSKRKGQITGRFCRSHAPRGAQLLNGGCEVQGCSKQASYGLASIRNKRFCASHKEDGMVHIGDLLKKERTQCRTDGCEEKAIYGASRMGPTHCSDHADDIIGTAIDFTQKCTEDGCKRRMAVWGDKSQPHDFTHCDAHKLPDQVPLKKWHQRNGPGVPVDTTKMIYV
ncbi:hypothetical protein JKP88DRAFT_202217 [Tribonema minus]|uniref:EsV-1-7 n=1 Tax=Tribonema minus TaxID=303371 RepID=A0A835YV75_9STRA|nr:hypothetical protein JKP88DRAFT_202217 [Tribonema minus]